MEPVQLVNTVQLNTFDEKIYDQPVLIVYPRHPNRTALFAYLLERTDAIVHYYALSAQDTSTASFLNHLSNDPQFPTAFGQQLKSALDKSNNPVAWAEAFGADLNKLHSEHFLLIL